MPSPTVQRSSRAFVRTIRRSRPPVVSHRCKPSQFRRFAAITSARRVCRRRGMTVRVLMDYLDRVDVDAEHGRNAFRLPVQLVNRPNPDFRGYCGSIAEGELRPGDRVQSMPSATVSAVREVFVGEHRVDLAFRGQAVMLTLADELDTSRGDVLVGMESPVQAADQFEAQVLVDGRIARCSRGGRT